MWQSETSVRPFPSKLERMATGAEVPQVRAIEVKALHESKAGVKGLLDSGVAKIPTIFTHPAENLAGITDRGDGAQIEIPVVDLEGLKGPRRKEIVEQIRRASETWGFFQVVNHGIPIRMMEEVLQGIRKFYEQPVEVKKVFRTLDLNKNVRLWSNYDQYLTQAGNWRDTLTLVTAPQDASKELPIVCREIMNAYAKEAKRLADNLFEILSEALGLSPDYLKNMECNKGQTFNCNYYPACPEPELTLGTSNHTDPSYISILIQDHIGGLQVLNQQKWIDVPPVHGALVINVGDLLQIVSNDKFKSGEHRVLANNIGPRVSVACFAIPDLASGKSFAPIKELIYDGYLPIFKEVTIKEYTSIKIAKGLDGGSFSLDYFKL